MNRLLFLSALSLLTLLTSCGGVGCEETRETYCIAELNPVSGTKIENVYVYGIGQGKGEKDSLGIAADEEMLYALNPETLDFILNPDTTVTTLRLQITASLENEKFQIDDTLFVAYEPRPYFLNMECGCSVFFTLKSISTTHNLIQDVTIKRNEITNAQNINLSIEF